MSIVIQDLYKAFGPKEVLRGFSLRVEEGETVAVVGQYGTGKSVLLKHIVGLLTPDAGSVHVDGAEVAALARPELYALRRRVGYVFQFAALFDSMTLAENVGMALRRVEGVTPEEIERRVHESLAMVNLEGLGDRTPAQLSGGQRKRAGLARAIITRPKYILYDEPTTGLDPVTTRVIDDLIDGLGQELGVTALVVTHDMGSAYRIADRVAMLYEGKVRFVGTPDEIQGADDPVVRGFIEGDPGLFARGVEVG